MPQMNDFRPSALSSSRFRAQTSPKPVTDPARGKAGRVTHRRSGYFGGVGDDGSRPVQAAKRKFIIP